MHQRTSSDQRIPDQLIELTRQAWLLRDLTGDPGVAEAVDLLLSAARRLAAGTPMAPVPVPSTPVLHLSDEQGNVHVVETTVVDGGPEDSVWDSKPSPITILRQAMTTVGR